MYERIIKKQIKQKVTTKQNKKTHKNKNKKLQPTEKKKQQDKVVCVLILGLEGKEKNFHDFLAT